MIFWVLETGWCIGFLDYRVWEYPNIQISKFEISGNWIIGFGNIGFE